MIAVAQKVIDRANADGLPDNHHLRVAAHRLDSRMRDYIDGKPGAKASAACGTFSRLKIAWFKYTGERL